MINLGHGGAQCPGSAEVSAASAAPDPRAASASTHYEGNQNSEDEDWIEEEQKAKAGDYLCNAPPAAGNADPEGNRYLTIVDRSGVHDLAVHWCNCSGAAAADLQLFNAGFFPASYKRIKSAFTFQVLDDFLIDNLECKTSASSFYSKLRRITCKAFPDSIPVQIQSLTSPKNLTHRQDRYQEFLRVSRQWRNLKYLRWHGFGHRKAAAEQGAVPGPGELALFCAACPQPGINMGPDEYKGSDR